jgi:hypothetical protein
MVALAGVASAQVAMQYNNVTGGPAPWPQVAPTQTPAVGPAYLASGGPYGSPGPGYGANPALSPGNISVRILGRIYASFGFTSDQGNGSHSVTPTVTASAVGSVGSPQANTKLAPYGMWTYTRFYPSFDAVAANGMKYGAYVEIRTDNAVAPGGGANGSVSGSVRARGELYLRRTSGYIGADNLGFLRFGATDQPTSLMLTGNFENFDDGGWNGDPILMTSGTQLQWPYEDVGNLYATEKIVYMSPLFANILDFGVSFEPSTGTVGENGNGPGNCPYGVTASGGVQGPLISNQSLGCDSASSSSLSSETQRRRNTFDAVLRGRYVVGPLGIVATVGGMYSSHVGYSGTFTNNSTTGGNTVMYHGLRVFDAGLQVAYGGFMVGGHILYGSYNNQWGTVSPDGSSKSFAPLIGASYSYGPNIIGFHYFISETPGSWTSANAVNPANGASVGKVRLEQGLAIGDTITLAPGAFLMVSYLYGHRHQAGVDLLSGATWVTGVNSSGATPRTQVVTNNNTRVQGIWAGMMFRW